MHSHATHAQPYRAGFLEIQPLVLMTEAESAETFDQVREYYGRILQSTKDLKTSACCTAGRPPEYLQEALSRVPESVMNRYYGCGNPIPTGIKGLTLLDLGCGSGRDCYIASQWIGSSGRVIGLDMTEEQLKVARDAKKEFESASDLADGLAPIEFLSGNMEFMCPPDQSGPIQPESVDIVISNCVVNLSPRKDLVLQSVYRALREGGEFYFSDVYCDRRLPDSVRQHKVLWGECIAGAMYVEDFKELAREIGFRDPRQLSIREIPIEDSEFQRILGGARFYSITFRLFKLKDLELRCEDYGQIGYYNGGIEGAVNSYKLDKGHEFVKNKPMLICGNTASMLENSWLRPYFTVQGDKTTHYGLFDCSGASAASETEKCC